MDKWIRGLLLNLLKLFPTTSNNLKIKPFSLCWRKSPEEVCLTSSIFRKKLLLLPSRFPRDRVVYVSREGDEWGWLVKWVESSCKVGPVWVMGSSVWPKWVITEVGCKFKWVELGGFYEWGSVGYVVVGWGRWKLRDGYWVGYGFWLQVVWFDGFESWRLMMVEDGFEDGCWLHLLFGLWVAGVVRL